MTGPRLSITLSFLAFSLPLGLTAMASAGEPFSFDKAYGRLPKNVVPTDYQIAIVPDAKKRTLSGTETVTLTFREATDTIQFNSLNDVLRNVRLDGKPVKSVATDDHAQLTTVTLAAAVPAGTHLLTFSYQGKIETKPQGLFAQPYATPQSKGELLSTQFEQTDARRMFPCWDEPAFRATYKLTVTIPAEWTAISNMPIEKRTEKGGLATVSFARTPKMPSYLLEFSAGDLASISARKDGVTFTIWAVRGQEKDGAYALANAQQILSDYNEYFDYPFPLPKLDSIAVPGGFSGAMENWGAITYNDQLLLVTPSTTLPGRQEVFSVQAHEMAHQWNGDLVTMGWWDDIWLNESFASWRAAKETDLRNPTWKWWEAEDQSKEDAMAADARLTSHAIEQHVTDELQAANVFDPQITYAKGQAVLRMLEAWLGEDVFRDGIRRYMKAHAYSNATSADLWNALSAAGNKDVGAIAAGWTEKPGFPLVLATARCDGAGNRTLSLSQRRFLLRGDDPTPSHWAIPLQIRAGAEGTPQAVLLTEDGQSAPAGRCDQPLSVNADAIGYFRTLYDDATLQTNSTAFPALKDSDRIALLDDQWALVESGRQPLASYLTLVEAMGQDVDTRAWEQITSALGTLEVAERGTQGHDHFTAYARALLKPVAAQLGWDARADDTPGILKLRRTVLADLGAWNDPATIAEARKRFAAFAADHGKLSADDQTMVLSIVARNASPAEFEHLHAIAKSAANETELRRYYHALTLVRDPALAEQAGKIILSSEIPPQADALRVSFVASLHDGAPQLSWTLFTGTIDRLMAPQASFAGLIIAQYSPEIFWNSVPLDEMEGWIKAHVPEEMAENIARGMETAHFRVAEKTALSKAADAYLAAHPVP